MSHLNSNSTPDTVTSSDGLPSPQQSKNNLSRQEMFPSFNTFPEDVDNWSKRASWGKVSLIFSALGLLVVLPALQQGFLNDFSSGGIGEIVFFFGFGLIFGSLSLHGNIKKQYAIKHGIFNEKEHPSNLSITLGKWGFIISLAWPLIFMAIFFIMRLISEISWVYPGS